MTDSDEAQTAPVEERPDRSKPDRPTGVMILGTLHVLGGIVMFVSQLSLITDFRTNASELRSIGLPAELLVAAVILLSTVTLASGIGMWSGTRWGWWLAAFCYLYAVARNISAVVQIALNADAFADIDRGLQHFITRHAGQAVISGLLYLYFFQDNVREYFGVQSVHRGKATAKLAGICALISAVFTAWMGLSP